MTRRMLLLLSLLVLPAFGQGLLGPNGSFEQGQGNQPSGWQLTGQTGAWERPGRTGERCLSVSGTGVENESSRWLSDPVPVDPGRTYRLTYWAKAAPDSSGGCIVSGLGSVNRDFQAGPDWTRLSYCFTPTTGATAEPIHLGQWSKKGTVYFDDVALSAVEPVHSARGVLVLGAGEAIQDGRYLFEPDWGSEKANYSRVLGEHTASFNSNRWPFGAGQRLEYRLGAGSITQTGGSLRVSLGYYQGGECVIEAAREDAPYREVARVRDDGEHVVELPANLYPARTIGVRLTSTGGFQVTGLRYEAALAETVADFVGETRFVEVEHQSPALQVAINDLGTLLPGGGRVRLTGTSPAARQVAATVTLTPTQGEALTSEQRASLPAGAAREIAVPYDLSAAGDWTLSLALADARTNEVLYAANTAFTVASLHDSSFGYLVSRTGDGALWWCEGTYKVSRERALPQAEGRTVRIAAARNEYEPFQIVVRPERDAQVTLAPTPLRGPGGAQIAAANVSVGVVGYVAVTIPTDSIGGRGDWPDPLPPYEGAVACSAGRNQPFWVTVKVPKGIPAGDYRGSVRVGIGNAATEVPVQLHVWDFELTDETHTRTAYGVHVDSTFHGLKSRAQETHVHDLYMQNCRDHRIAPYSPMQYWPIEWEVQGPRTEVDTGSLRLVCDEFSGNFWDVYIGDRTLGSVKSLITQFEKEGIGWEGTGTGWPSAERIEDVQIVEQTPDLLVIEMTGVRRSSSEANRAYAARHRFTIRPDNWFRGELLWVRNTDTVPWTLRTYFHLLPPAEPIEVEGYNAQTYGAWLGPRGAIGAVVEPPGQMTFALRKADANAAHGDISWEAGEVLLQPGQTFTPTAAPAVRFFVVPEGTREAADAAAQRTVAEIGRTVQYTRPLRVSRQADEQISITYDEFDQAATRYLDEFGFNSFNFPAMPGSIAGEPQFSPRFRELYQRIYTPIAQHLAEKGWLQKAYSYWFDEPTEEQYPHVIQGMDLIKEGCPGLTRLLTEQPEPALHGHVDLWVPVLSMYNPERCHERQAQGEQVWWYVCCGPLAPYPNNFIDHPALNHRIRFWMAEKYGVTGSLYWSATYYRGIKGAVRSPWETAMSYNPDGGRWGNGDGMLLYPPTRQPSDTPVIAGPVNSIRWELLREGLEDREYFWTLRQRLPKTNDAAARRRAEAALRLPDRLADSLTEFDHDPQAMYEARRELAEAIEALALR